jgi:hypothetical protein
MPPCKRAYSGKPSRARRMAGCRLCFNGSLPYRRARYSNAAGSPGIPAARGPSMDAPSMALPALSKYMSRDAAAGRLFARIEHGFEAVGLDDAAGRSPRRRARNCWARPPRVPPTPPPPRRRHCRRRPEFPVPPGSPGIGAGDGALCASAACTAAAWAAGGFAR